MKYHAFISYNKAADHDLAPAIRAGLEKFAKPVFRRKALNIFLDSSALSATPDLWNSIENGLKNADYFIFMASPGSAKSIWCIKELEYWRQHKDMNKLLLVWTSGQLDWDNLTGDFNWHSTTALPAQLKGAFKNEPLYIDLREHATLEKLNLTDPIFRNQVGMLAAPLHQKALEDLLGEDIRIHKRTIRLRNGAIGILSILLLVSILLSVFAVQQKNIAEKKAIETLARSYISDSKANLDLNPTLAVRLAEYAYLFAKANALDLENFEDQLIKAWYNPSNFYLSPEELQPVIDTIITKHEYADYKLGIDENTNELCLTTADGTRYPYPNNSYGDPPDYYTFSPKGKFIITEGDLPGASYAGTQRVLTIHQYPDIVIANVESYIEFGTKGNLRNRVKFNAAETRFILTGEYPGTSVYDFSFGEVKSILLHGESRDVQDILISGDGKQVALAKQKGVIDFFEMDTSAFMIRQQWQLRGHAYEALQSIKFSRDKNFISTQSANYNRNWHAYYDVSDRYVQFPEVSIANEERLETPTYNNTGSIHFRFEADSIYATYLDNRHDTVANFHLMNEGVGDEAVTINSWASPDGRYTTTRNGLFNKRGELLIDFNENRHKYKFEVTALGFSTNSKFLYLVDKIYFLDAAMIISKMNAGGKNGAIAPLGAADKETYKISDIQ